MPKKKTNNKCLTFLSIFLLSFKNRKLTGRKEKDLWINGTYTNKIKKIKK